MATTPAVRAKGAGKPCRTGQQKEAVTIESQLHRATSRFDAVSPDVYMGRTLAVAPVQYVMALAMPWPRVNAAAGNQAHEMEQELLV